MGRGLGTETAWPAMEHGCGLQLPDAASALPRPSGWLPKPQYPLGAAYSFPGHKSLSFRDLIFLLDADAGGEGLMLRTEESLWGKKGQAMLSALSVCPLLTSAPPGTVSAPMSYIRKLKLGYRKALLRAAKCPSQQVVIQAGVPKPAPGLQAFPPLREYHSTSECLWTGAVEFADLPGALPCTVREHQIWETVLPAACPH